MSLGNRNFVSSVIPQSTNTWQAVEVLDHSYSSSEINHAQSSYSSVCDKREAKMMKSLFHGSVCHGNPVFNLVEILIFIRHCDNINIDCVIGNEEW